jgi:hypothetical protein
MKQPVDPQDKGNAARCRRWSKKRRALGLVRITVEVPADRADELKTFANSLREAFAVSPTLEPLVTEASISAHPTPPDDPVFDPASLSVSVDPAAAVLPARPQTAEPWRNAESRDWWARFSVRRPL